MLPCPIPYEFSLNCRKIEFLRANALHRLFDRPMLIFHNRGVSQQGNSKMGGSILVIPNCDVELAVVPTVRRRYSVRE
jgi:hypothetical protein